MSNQILPLMRFKGFIFPNNPRTCSYAVSRTYANHKYPELRGAELEDMDVDAAVITGEGEFSGDDAYVNWLELLNVFNQHGVGDFYHPIYINISQALMTKLKCDMEPRSNYVSYSFEFVAHGKSQSNPVSIPYNKSLIYNNMSNNVVQSKSGVTDITVVVGDTVICNGYAYYNSYGSEPHSALLSDKLMTVTYINEDGTHPVCVGSIGWMALSDISLGNTIAISSNSGYVEYVVMAGDTLWDIGNKYSISWKDIASFNNMKNPNVLHIGDVIKIPV